jgi:recombinational DNA repair protein (RecF pathway)
VILAGVKDADPHPELFHYLLGFLDGLNRLQNDITKQVLFLLRSLFGIAAHMGFALDFDTCAVCGVPLDRCDKGEVDIVKGVVCCQRCMSKTASSVAIVQSNMLDIIKMTDDTFWSREIEGLSRQRLLSLLRLGSDYCRYHLEIRKNFESFLFIEHLFGITSNR